MENGSTTPEVTENEAVETTVNETPAAAPELPQNASWAIHELFLGKKVTHESFAPEAYIFHQPDVNPENPGTFLLYAGKQNSIGSFAFGAAELKMESGWKTVK